MGSQALTDSLAILMLPIKLPEEPAKETDAAAGETPSAAWHLADNCSPRENKLFT